MTCDSLRLFPDEVEGEPPPKQRRNPGRVALQRERPQLHLPVFAGDPVGEEEARLEEFAAEHRPLRRSECREEARPCPWVSCRWHLYHGRFEEFAAIIESLPDVGQCPACSARGAWGKPAKHEWMKTRPHSQLMDAWREIESLLSEDDRGPWSAEPLGPSGAHVSAEPGVWSYTAARPCPTCGGTGRDDVGIEDAIRVAVRAGEGEVVATSTTGKRRPEERVPANALVFHRLRTNDVVGPWPTCSLDVATQLAGAEAELVQEDAADLAGITREAIRLMQQRSAGHLAADDGVRCYLEELTSSEKIEAALDQRVEWYGDG